MVVGSVRRLPAPQDWLRKLRRGAENRCLQGQHPIERTNCRRVANRGQKYRKRGHRLLLRLLREDYLTETIA